MKTFTTLIIVGESFELMDGVLGMALSPWRRGRDRYLYFHSLASTTENVVRTGVLRNDSFIEHPNAEAMSINVSVTRKFVHATSDMIIVCLPIEGLGWNFELSNESIFSKCSQTFVNSTKN